MTQTDSPVEAYVESPPRKVEKRPFVRWLTNPFVIALAAIVVFNLVWALPRYLHFDPKLSRVPLDPRFPHQWHFQIVVTHVLTANLALLLVFFQLSSRLRRRFPVVHRTSGRVYVFAGALPTSLLALWLVPYGHQPFGELGQGAEGALWFFTTAMGFVRARQGRYVDHRRWMIYSFALALGTTWGRLIVWGMSIIPGFTIGLNWLFEVSSWLGWFINLLIAYWWVERTAPRAHELVA